MFWNANFVTATLLCYFTLCIPQISMNLFPLGLTTQEEMCIVRPVGDLLSLQIVVSVEPDKDHHRILDTDSLSHILWRRSHGLRTSEIHRRR